jgi:membrane-associated phospholipid phosphatase
MKRGTRLEKEGFFQRALTGLWWPEKAILIYQLALLGALVACSDRVENLYSTTSLLLFAIVLMLVCRGIRPQAQPLKGFCDWGYLYLVVFINYLLTCYLIPYYRTVDGDLWLVKADQMLFSVDPTWWGPTLNRPWVVEVFTWGYLSYYFFGLALTLPIYMKYGPKSRAFREVFISVITSFYLTYIGYWLFPAQGPRIFWEDYLEPLKGLFLSAHVFSHMDAVEKGFPDAFPSEHTAFSLVMMYMLYRHDRNMFRFMAPWGVLAIGATVVLRYHWIVDVLAGAALAVLVCAFSVWAGGRERKTSH